MEGSRLLSQKRRKAVAALFSAAARALQHLALEGGALAEDWSQVCREFAPIRPRRRACVGLSHVPGGGGLPGAATAGA